VADDLYKALGVSKKASDEEIKRAYRTLARQYGFGGRPGGPGAGPFGGGGGGFGSDLGDIFSNIFSRGGGGPEPQQPRGRDLETETMLSFDQAVNGAQVSVTVPKQDRCTTPVRSSRTPARPAAAPA
jgi:molecular chaperone DnaJ